ncbi:hypothetical protein F4859DRAFT_381521 [Xylaria cf. heliscus]|nr:hypothetical protein F4859DRAFT_381521 [Xylaria cf. heliscus]
MRMRQSWLLRCSLLIVVATGEALTYNHDTESSIEIAPSVLGQSPRVGDFVLHEVAVPEAIEEKAGFESLSDRTTVPTSVPVEREELALRIPRPTAIPSLRKRQDDGQIQALSAQLQSLSQSATQAISSVSSSASSILSQMSQSSQSIRQSADQARQSADQAIQSANQAADQANRQLSQTVSSASSAVSAVSARASDQISQSLASMSSQISANLASAQSSASNAISSARVAASQFAASQIQAAQATVNGPSGNANSSVGQAQSDSVSTSILAIAITVSIVGTAILSTLSTCLLLRYRRRKRSARGEKALESNERTYDQPVAVRGSISPRFPRFGRGLRSTMDDFKLPSLSPLMRSMRAPRDTRFDGDSATSGYSDQEESASLTRDASDMDGAQPLAFRLQKDNGVSSATAVRLIRVNSDKAKARSSMEIQPTRTESIPPLPMISVPYDSLKATPVSTQDQPATQSTSQIDNIITQPPKSKEPPPIERRASTRSIGRAFDAETSGSRPPTRLTATDPNRFRFRDSSDLESEESTPTNLGTSTRPPSNINVASLRTPRPATLSRQSSRGDFIIPPGQPKNGKGTFATFPRIRTDLARGSTMSRGGGSMIDRRGASMIDRRGGSMIDRGGGSMYDRGGGSMYDRAGGSMYDRGGGSVMNRGRPNRGERRTLGG